MCCACNLKLYFVGESTGSSSLESSNQQENDEPDSLSDIKSDDYDTDADPEFNVANEQSSSDSEGDEDAVNTPNCNSAPPTLTFTAAHELGVHQSGDTSGATNCSNKVKHENDREMQTAGQETNSRVITMLESAIREMGSLRKERLAQDVLVGRMNASKYQTRREQIFIKHTGTIKKLHKDKITSYLMQ